MKKYKYTAEDRVWVNSKVVLEDYNMKSGIEEEVPVSFICNQIIHSYSWAVIHNGKNNIHGILVASEKEKDKDVILLSIKEWLNVINEVVEKSTI